MARRHLLMLCATLVAAVPDVAQPAQNRVFAELGGTGASASINYERTFGSVFSARAGLGTSPFGVDVAGGGRKKPTCSTLSHVSFVLV